MVVKIELPPYPGYTEVVMNGRHTYRNNRTGEITDNPVLIPSGPTIDDLEHENTLLRAQVQAMSDRNDFIEDCIAEMAEIVYA